MTGIVQSVVCVDREGNRKEVPTADLVFRPSIYGIIIEDGKILLSRQWDGYDFPGGGVEKGERLDEALMREVREETGLVVRVGRLVGCGDAFFTTPFENRHTHSILLYRLCRIESGELSTAFFDEDEKRYAQMAEWIDLESVSGLIFCNSIDSVRIIREAVKMTESSEEEE
jgi:8-oxo-dGTP diphosphatase